MYLMSQAAVDGWSEEQKCSLASDGAVEGDKGLGNDLTYTKVSGLPELDLINRRKGL